MSEWFTLGLGLCGAPLPNTVFIYSWLTQGYASIQTHGSEGTPAVLETLPRVTVPLTVARAFDSAPPLIRVNIRAWSLTVELGEQGEWRSSLTWAPLRNQ